MLLWGCQDVVGHLGESFDPCSCMSQMFPYVQRAGQRVLGQIQRQLASVSSNPGAEKNLKIRVNSEAEKMELCRCLVVFQESELDDPKLLI